MTLRDAPAKRITLNVDVAEARDLLQRVPRACLAYVSDDGPVAEPVRVLAKGDSYLIEFPPCATGSPTNGQEAVLVIDDGVQFFDLRAVYVRGHLAPVDADNGASSDSLRLELEPTRVVAWDYSRIRETDDER